MKINRTHFFWRVFFCFLLSYSAFALDRERTLEQFHHTAWASKDGAPSQISALAQTTDGFLWIGSAKGLFRFDGIEFEPFVAPAGIELPSHNIYALEATPDGGLWISFRPSGLGFLQNGRLEIFNRPEEIPKSQVYCFAGDLDNRIWAGTHDGLVLREGANWIEIGTDWNFKPQRIRTLFVDRSGTLWVATDETIVFLERGTRFFQEIGARVSVVPKFAQAPDGRLWIAENERSVRPISTNNQNAGAEETEIMTGALGILFDRDGALWITDRKGLRRVRFPERLGKRKIKMDDSGVEFFNEQNGLSGDYSNHILEDREGNIWVSTAKGLDRFRYCHFVPVKSSKGLQNLTLLTGGNGEVWAASATEKPLAHLLGENIISENKILNISSFYRETSGVVWWGGMGGIWRQKNNRFDFFAQPKDKKTDWIWEVIRGGEDGGLWIGLGDVGLVYFKDGVWENRDVPQGLLKRVPSASFHDADERIWLGYTDNRVYLLDGENVRAFTGENGIDIGRIRVIRGRGGHFWFGGELGLAYYDNGRFRTIHSASGERFGTISGIVLTADGALWLNEIKGVVRISPEEVRRAIENPNYQVNDQLFNFLDGLPGGTQMNWTVSTAVEATDGRIWFATDNGLTWINPARMEKNNLPPPVVVKSLTANEKTYQSTEILELPKGTESLRINYTALSLSIPERVRFKYRLEGFDDSWHDAGTRREVFFTNLGPGNYRFQIIASNNDSVWNEEGATVEFMILPMFYQTNWFLMLCGVALAFFAWLIYRRRVRTVKTRLHHQFEERLMERTRIAQDLHDTLLQGFVSASMQLDVAVDNLPADSPARPRLTRVHTLIGQLIVEGRNTVKGLRYEGNGGSTDFETEFLRVGREIDLRKQVNFRVIIEGSPRALHPVIGDEAFHIGQEALVNAFRHSKATVIEVGIEYAPKYFRILVRDNGCGIDPQILRSGREGHWGLKGMRERAEKIGARLKVWSRAAAGTEVELAIPNRIAFRNQSANGFLKRLRKFTARNSEKEQTNER
jgi:signal transduction histidine kinase/ligand-binding sensor domain-containing protein